MKAPLATICLGLAVTLGATQAGWSGFGLWWTLYEWEQPGYGEAVLHAIGLGGGLLVIGGAAIIRRRTRLGGGIGLIGASLGVTLWYSPLNILLTLVLLVILAILIYIRGARPVSASH